MKKFFAALLAISITAALAGCNKSADGQTAEGTVSETVSETITTTTSETSAETVSETEETTNNYQEYVPDLSADMCLAELYFGMSREETEAAVNADPDEDMLNMYYSVYNNISIDLDENFKSATFGYGESGLDEITLNLKEIPQKEWLEIKDELISKLSGIYGVSSDDWEIESGGYSNYCESSSGISVFLRVYDSGDNIVGSLMLTSWEHRSFKNVEKLSVINKEEDTTAKTSETAETSSVGVSETGSNDEPRLAQHEDLIGCWRNSEYQTTFIFEENRYIGLDKGWGEIVDDTVKDGILSFSDNEWGLSSNLTATICGDKLFVEEKEDDGETYLYEFERYTQPAMSLQDFNGDMSIGYYCGGPDGDLFDFENGKGKFLPSGKMRSEPDAITDAEIILHEDKVTLTVGDDTGDYKYYTLENTATYVRFIYLIDDKKIIDLIQFI